MSVVQAVIESTQQNIRHLEEQAGSEARYDASGIKRLSEEILIDGTLQQTYSCRVPQHLSLRPGTAALLVFSNAPDDMIGIQLLSYDRSHGDLKFAASEKLADEEGKIVISFLWLIQRCLEWYREKGATIPGALARTGNIVSCSALPPGVSDEQVDAIRTVLTEPYSYVLGPPGTGKTNWVLANAVNVCVEDEQVVLALASTNLAVDNALVAVLEKGISEKHVLRVGIPGYKFKERYPSCCESNAFTGEILKLKELIAATSQDIEVLGQLPAFKTALSQLSQQQSALKDLDGKLVDVGSEKEGIDSELEVIARHGKSLQAEIQKLEDERSVLNYEGVESEISGLETDSSESIQRRNQCNAELNGLTWLKRTFFTGRQNELSQEIESIGRHLNVVEQILMKAYARRDSIKPEFDSLSDEIVSRRKEVDAEREIWKKRRNDKAGCSAEISRLSSMRKDLSDKVDGLRARSDQYEQFRIRHPDSKIPSLVELKSTLAGLKQELEGFETDLSGRLVLGMTLDGFIGLTLGASIRVDRVFLDEAPYAPLAKVLPLLSLNCPIAFLGDHKQLPPVCQNQNDPIIRSFWAKPSIFIEEAYRIFRGDHRNGFEELNKMEDEDRSTKILKQTNLTASYRFGQKLSSLLDKHIYGMGLQGVATEDTLIKCLHCEPVEQEGRKEWQNPAEADSIVRELDDWWHRFGGGDSIPTIAILTPYKNQVSLLREKVNAHFGFVGPGAAVEILNTHQAQGREWDWVFFSVSDTGNLVGNGPFLADTRKKQGRPLVNTTLSRARSHLWIFLDQNFWRARNEAGGESLIAEIAQTY